MTIEKLVSLLKATGYPVAYSHFVDTEENPAPNPPFICYVLPNSDNHFADNKTFHQIKDVDIELYTDYKDFEAERKIEEILNANNIPWNNTEVWIEKEKLFQKIYEVRLI